MLGLEKGRGQKLGPEAFHPTVGLESSAASVPIQALLSIFCVALGTPFQISRGLHLCICRLSQPQIRQKKYVA